MLADGGSPCIKLRARPYPYATEGVNRMDADRLFAKEGAPTAEQILSTLVRLLEDQEGVTIEYRVAERDPRT